jgi:predicted nucleic acid-binding protein
MILVDSSVWIHFLSSTYRQKIDPGLARDLATCGVIVQEVLQGIKNDLAHQRIKEAFLAMKVLENPLQIETYLEASDLYRRCRRNGVTVRSPVDCLIAIVAVKNSAQLWHRDRDFSALGKFVDLKIYEPKHP